MTKDCCKNENEVSHMNSKKGNLTSKKKEKLLLGLLGILVVFSLFQTMELMDIRDNALSSPTGLVSASAAPSTSAPSAATGSSSGNVNLPKSLQNLPNMVGGC